MKLIRERAHTVDVDEFLARPLFAHFSTASEKSPRESPVWFLWEDGAIWIIGSRSTDTFLLRVQSEARCAIGVVDFDRTTGLVQHVGMRGRAAIQPFDAGRACRLLGRYLGPDASSWDERFRTTLIGRDQEVLVRFAPETMVARDVSYEPAAPR